MILCISIVSSFVKKKFLFSFDCSEHRRVFISFDKLDIVDWEIKLCLFWKNVIFVWLTTIRLIHVDSCQYQMLAHSCVYCYQISCRIFQVDEKGGRSTGIKIRVHSFVLCAWICFYTKPNTNHWQMIFYFCPIWNGDHSFN